VLEELNSAGGDITDNPEKAHRILRRAKFEDKFVNHVARRSYKGSIIQFENE
jgi:hypothetical protein